MDWLMGMRENPKTHFPEEKRVSNSAVSCVRLAEELIPHEEASDRNL